MSAVLSELTARARSLIEKLDPAAALAAVAGQDGAEATVLLVRAGALAALDQFREAYDLVCGLLERRELGPAERLEALVHKARLLRKASRKVDLALETAFEAASAGTQQGGSALALAGEAHIEAALLLSRKRCRKLAARSLAAAAAALPDDPRALVFEGLVMVDFDERLEARAKFEAARERGGAGGERWGRLALAHVDTLLGDFDAARAHLAALTPLAPGDLWGRWLAVRLALAQHDWLRAAEALGDLVSASPRADAVHHYEYERAGALYRAGRKEEARAAFAGLAAAAGEDEESARAARRMTRLLAREGAASRPSRRLQAFPSVMQLRNHCGPASCELYLRFYGRRADQVDIAREIKFADGGTPVYRARS